MLTSCLKEKMNKCIPIDISMCEKCTSFEFDPEKCNNYKTTYCNIKEECPCKNWQPLED